MITHKRHTTTAQKLANYKHLVLSKTRKQIKRISRISKHCTLCGCRVKHNKFVLPCVSQIITKNKTVPVNQNLTCANYDIYVASCVICHEHYVGQTSNKLSVRWSSRRSNWNKQNCKTDNDHMVLSRHYSKVEKLRHVEFIIKQKQMIFKNLKVSFVPKRLVMVPRSRQFCRLNLASRHRTQVHKNHSLCRQAALDFVL